MKIFEEWILPVCEDFAVGYIFEVNLSYFETLHELRNDYPLVPERLNIIKVYYSSDLEQRENYKRFRLYKFKR